MGKYELLDWIVKPDGWAVGGPLEECTDWDKAEYRLESWHTRIKLAVSVAITGRTHRQSPIGYAVRCAITFVGDCEPDVIVRGWARAPQFN